MYFLKKAICVILMASIILPAPSAFAESDDEIVSSETKLAPGFLIELSSSQDQKLNGRYRVSQDAKIELPYSITLHTKGMTLGKFQETIKRSYQPYFKGNPNVQATVRQKRYYIEIRGIVNNPGSYLVKRNASLDDILSEAGGLAEKTLTGYARIEQNGETKWVSMNDYFAHGKRVELPEWIGGDLVFFQKEKSEGGDAAWLEESHDRVQILGEVKNPGELAFKKNADGFYYLSKTGGPTTQADLSKVEVVRTNFQTGSRDRIYYGSINDVKSLQEADLVIIHPARQSSFERVLGSVGIIGGLLSASLISYIAVRNLSK